MEIEILQFYNKDEEPQVEKALNEMGWPFLIEKFKGFYKLEYFLQKFYMIISSFFLEEKIDFDGFLNLNSFYIYQLLKDFKLGWSIKFEKMYNDWKSNHLIDSSQSTLMQRETKVMVCFINLNMYPCN